MKNLIIGIAGGSSSGKTTLALRLKERFGEDEVRLISHDSYYKRHDELPFEERCKLNYDHPDAFDNALLIYHLQELKAGRAIDCPVYDYADHNRSNKVQHIEPAPVLIVEGILPFVEPELCELFDYKIYVDTDADERILRRRAGPLAGQRHPPVPHHGQTHARGLCGAQQAERGHHRAQRRREQHRRGDAGPPHPKPD
jgi:uridine kinase